MTQTIQSWEQLQSLFRAAIEQSPLERDAFITQSCADDGSLLDQLRDLLAAHDQAQDFLAEPAWTAITGGAAVPSVPNDENTLVGRRVGQYQINRVIASGGMGTVYEAVQEQPRRTVALKIMRSGLASRAALRRFEFEVEVLGRLQHPYIAQIFEAGTFQTDAGVQPFFAMELIHGQPLVEYATTQKLTTAQKLSLLVKICEGIDHAHQKGVIHRDLKPDNILIVDQGLQAQTHQGKPPPAPTSEGDACLDDSMVPRLGLPKILDFGIARATGLDIQHATQRTDIGQLIGTIAYMSPEQIAGDPDQIDTRCDVYALGVICYELLTGRLPHDDLRRKTVPEAVRTVREQEPRPLSSIDRTLRGDLEWITMKAIEKDRARRYGSAAQLAADIVRHLHHQPVLAGPPSATYRFSKMVSRQRAAVIAGLGIVISLVAGTTLSTLMYLEAARQRDRAQEERNHAVDAKKVAQSSFRQAMDIAGRMTYFAESELSNLAGGTKARKALAETALQDLVKLEAAAPGGPSPYLMGYAYQRVGEVHMVMGHTTEALASHLTALDIRQRQAQAEPADRATQRALGVGYWKVSEAQTLLGRFDDAQENNRKSLEIHEALSGADTAVESGVYLGIAYRRIADIQTIMGQGGQALENYQRSLDWANTGLKADPNYVELLRGRALVLRGTGEALAGLGRRREAIEEIGASLQVLQLLVAKSGPSNVWDRTNMARTYLSLAQVQSALGDKSQALQSAQQAAELSGALSDADPENYESRHVLGRAQAATGALLLETASLSDAFASIRRAAELLESLAQLDPDNARVQRDYAVACRTLGQAHQALALQKQQTVATRTAQFNEARAWFSRASQSLKRLEDSGALPSADVELNDRLAGDIASCDSR